MLLACSFITYISPWIPIIAAIVAAVIVSWLGKRAYFRQKEYELIIKRYLEEGIDAISKNVEQSLSIFRYNWWKSIVILHNFENLGKDIHPKLIENPFIEPESSSFELWRHYRLSDIIGDKIFYEAHQLLVVLISKSYGFFQDDLLSTIRVAYNGGRENEIIAPRKKIISEYTRKIEDWGKSAESFYVILEMLQKIASRIEKKHFKFKEIKKYRKDSEIKSSVSSLKEGVEKMKLMLKKAVA